MSLLGTVAWGEVMGDLLAASPRDVRACAARYAMRAARPFDLGTAALAVMAVQMPGRARRALLDHTGPGGDPWALDLWLQDTARSVMAVIGLGTSETAPLAVAGDVPVHLDPAATGLPLLGALTEHAMTTAGRLAVVVAELETGFAGLCNVRGRVSLPSGSTAEAVVIRLAPGFSMDTWRHEAAHVFDPNRDPRSREEGETYADALATRLAKLPSDTPLPEVLTLADEVYVQVRQDYQRTRPAPIEHQNHRHTHPPDSPGAHLPAPGVASLLAFATLPVLAD